MSHCTVEWHLRKIAVQSLIEKNILHSVHIPRFGRTWLSSSSTLLPFQSFGSASGVQRVLWWWALSGNGSPNHSHVEPWVVITGMWISCSHLVARKPSSRETRNVGAPVAAQLRLTIPWEEPQFPQLCKNNNMVALNYCCGVIVTQQQWLWSNFVPEVRWWDL